MSRASVFSTMLLFDLYFIYTIFVATTLSVNPCKIVQEKADCSHLKLSQIPSDLPSDIKALDLSHNQLKQLPSANLSRYDQLVSLDVGYNTLHQFDPLLCEKLPRLSLLNLQHNEFTKISEKYFTLCSSLTELYLTANGISSISGNPFEKLESLCVLDLSHNKMTSTILGNKPQLPNLQKLILSSNKITELTKDGLAFLYNTSLKTLELSSNAIKMVSKECFHSLITLHTLVMDNMQLGANLVELVCTALAGTGIQAVSLNNVQLTHIYNTTFTGLEHRNLTTLNISQNSLSHIDDKSFAPLHQLESLNMENNQVSQLTPNTFYGLSNLTYLNLRKFFIKSKVSINDLSFQWLNNVEHLNMEENKISDLTENTFTGLTSLKMLNLSDCSINLQKITNKTFSSLSKSPLLVLDLTKTGIVILESGAFSSLSNLKVLDLGLNKINQELYGQEFQGLKNIEILYLSFNNRLTLRSNSFTYVSSLKRLYLRKTALTFTDLNPSPFKGLHNLTLLDLSNNNIANIEDNIFEGLDSLKILNLQHNNLARLWKHANPGGPVLFLKGLYSLEILGLVSNGFDEIPDSAFNGLPNLSILDLGENNVNIIPVSLFDDQRSLSILDLHKNLITAVEKEVFKNVFKTLTNLSMGGNPFDCTCDSIAWFADWLNKTNVTITGHTSQYKCNTPPRYHGIYVEYFDASSCKDNSPYILFILSFSFLITFLSLVVLIHFQGWRFEFYWNVSVNRILGFREVDYRTEDFDYDAYIIHAKDDLDWVENNLIPFEEDEPKLQFCIEERDFEAGISQLGAIVKSMKRSRKIIFVITNLFLKDPWCKRFKIQHAVQQAIEQSRDSIILIFLEDIPDYKLHYTIHLRRGMFQSHCILDWPAQKERFNAFRQKLKIALGSTNIIS